MTLKFPKPKKKTKRVLKAKFIRPSSIKSYDDALRALRLVREEKRRMQQSAYEAVLTQLFQKYIRMKGDCVLRNIRKPWACGGVMQAGHVFTRTVKELKWVEDNCHPTCASCNSMHQIFPTIYHDWAKEKLGEVEYNKLKEIATNRRAFFISYDEVLGLINKYLLLTMQGG